MCAKGETGAWWLSLTPHSSSLTPAFTGPLRTATPPLLAAHAALFGLMIGKALLKQCPRHPMADLYGLRT
jgi:hypothetical protein